MTCRAALVAGIAVALAASAAGDDVAFRKSKIADSQANEHRVDLIFEGDRKTLVLRQNQIAIALVPYAAIDQLAYSNLKRHWVKEGVQAMTSGCSGGITCLAVVPVSVVSGAVLMATKTKSHWFYIDYTDVHGPHELTLRLDKSEFQKILDSAKAHTGKDVAILPEP